MFALVLVSILCCVLCFVLAKRRGLNAANWVALAALIGPFAVPLLLLKKKPGDR